MSRASLHTRYRKYWSVAVNRINRKNLFAYVIITAPFTCKPKSAFQQRWKCWRPAAAVYLYSNSWQLVTAVKKYWVHTQTQRIHTGACRRLVLVLNIIQHFGLFAGLHSNTTSHCHCCHLVLHPLLYYYCMWKRTQ